MINNEKLKGLTAAERQFVLSYVMLSDNGVWTSGNNFISKSNCKKTLDLLDRLGLSYSDYEMKPKSPLNRKFRLMIIK